MHPVIPPKPILAAVATTALVLAGCDGSGPPTKGSGDSDATVTTAQSNHQVLEELPFDDRSDFEAARRGLIAQAPELVVRNNEGDRVWDMTEYDFIDEDGENAPSTVNPSLWRQAALNNSHGLFEVKEGIYQLRGYDLSNMTIIEGDTGWMLVDPLTARETASEAFRFAQQHLGDKPIRAILFTHSHIDHFGGVQGILQHLSEEEKEDLRIIAPEGFTEEATSENIITGPAMGRRAGTMYGRNLERNERGHVGSGLGKGPAFVAFGFIPPTELIRETGEKLTVDGVPMEFQIVSGTEAPAEFTFYLPEHKAFCGAELVSRNMHNLYTLRGAKVRDARLWSSRIEEARTLFSEADIYFGSHHWPVWGQEDVQDFLKKQRDTYKFIHDETVRMVNAGATPSEIADNLELPPALKEDFHNQGYYGTVAHNARAVYQYYMGWYDGNPAHLNPLPEAESAERYVAMMGGADRVLEQARAEFEETDEMDPADGRRTYRWLAELLNKVVFAQPDHSEAKALLAKVYEQLGYQAQSGPWRDVYLSGANELRQGATGKSLEPTVMREIMAHTPVELFFDSMAVRLNPDAAEGESMRIRITFTDLDRSYLLTVENSVLHHRRTDADTEADAALTLTRGMYLDLILGEAGLKEFLFSDDLNVDGSRWTLMNFFRMFDDPRGDFNIVTP